jgi:DNA mismatch repair protein MutL
LAQDASSLSVGQESIFPEENYAPSESAGLHFQYRGQYIVSATKTGLMIVDQHRAHVRILYDKYMAMMERRDNATQGLLFPELLSLPPSDAQILETISEDIRCLGFDISSLGGGSFSINGLPAGIDGLVPQTLIGNMVDAVREGGQADLSAYRHRIALSLASAAAIVVGQVLSLAEIDVLLADLMKSSNPNITPNGKTIIALLKPESIDAMFAKV